MSPSTTKVRDFLEQLMLICMSRDLTRERERERPMPQHLPYIQSPYQTLKSFLYYYLISGFHYSNVHCCQHLNFEGIATQWSKQFYNRLCRQMISILFKNSTFHSPLRFSLVIETFQFFSFYKWLVESWF